MKMFEEDEKELLCSLVLSNEAKERWRTDRRETLDEVAAGSSMRVLRVEVCLPPITLDDGWEVLARQLLLQCEGRKPNGQRRAGTG